jgi:N utilization substance protein B
MQARSTARELALLSLSQFPADPKKLQGVALQNVMLAAVRTLTGEVHDSLETAAAELERGSDRLLTSETRTTELQTARMMVKEAIELAQKAINRIGAAMELPEMVQMANQKEVRAYALEILTTVKANRSAIDQLLNDSMVDWRLERLPRLDQDLLRMAVAEMSYLGLAPQIAINEAIELAKRYSGEEGYRFINGVLRRVSQQLSKSQLVSPSVKPSVEVGEEPPANPEV